MTEIAVDFDVSVKTLYRWVAQADVDDGVKDGLTTAEQAEIVQLRRRARQLEMDVAIRIVPPTPLPVRGNSQKSMSGSVLSCHSGNNRGVVVHDGTRNGLQSNPSRRDRRR